MSPLTHSNNIAARLRGGWGIAGHANTNAGIAAAARAALAAD